MRAILIGIMLLPAWCIVGCDVRPVAPTTAPTSAPSTSLSTDDDAEQPDQTATLLKTATSRPAIPATVDIDDKEYDFPPARLRLQSREGRVVGILTSDDPPAAAEEGYTGNSIHLEFPLDIPESKTLAGAHAEIKPTNSNPDDEINGFYLKGQEIAVQPADVHVDVLGDVSPVKVRVGGRFLWFDDQNDVGRPVEVTAEMTAQVTIDSPGR